MNKKHIDEAVAKNASGYPDPTAGVAITTADEEYLRFRKLLKLIFTICELSGFHLEGRLTLKDAKTGRIWR